MAGVGSSWEVMVAYTLMVASTRGSVKWVMLGAPAVGQENRLGHTDRSAPSGSTVLALLLWFSQHTFHT